MIKWLKKQLTKILTPEKNASFKVVNISGKPEDKNTAITYQVRGKITSVTETPGKLVDELMYLKGFTKEDSEIIYSLALTENESPTYRLSTILFDENGSYLCIEDIKLQIGFKIKTSDIFTENNLLNRVSADTLKTILALHYSESFQAQSNSIKQQKKNDNATASLRIIK